MGLRGRVEDGWKWASEGGGEGGEETGKQKHLDLNDLDLLS